jgi:hypothetical protein
MTEVIALARIAFSQLPREAFERRELFMKRDYVLTIARPAPFVAVPRRILDDAHRIVIEAATGERWELVPPFSVRWSGEKLALIALATHD